MDVGTELVLCRSDLFPPDMVPEVLFPDWLIFTVEPEFNIVKGFSLIVAFVTNLGSVLLAAPPL